MGRQRKVSSNAKGIKVKSEELFYSDLKAPGDHSIIKTYKFETMRLKGFRSDYMHSTLLIRALALISIQATRIKVDKLFKELKDRGLTPTLALIN